MTQEEQEQNDSELLEKHCQQLMEQFDSVQIFVTRQNTEDDTTMSHTHGSGNWFCRIGQIKEWIIRQDEKSKIEFREPQD